MEGFNNCMDIYRYDMGIRKSFNVFRVFFMEIWRVLTIVWIFTVMIWEYGRVLTFLGFFLWKYRGI
jgi:hypothetical protein